MCGIISFYKHTKNSQSKPEVLNILINGLKRLEYRGYDSSGIAILTKDNQIFCQKEVGKVAQLEKKLKTVKLPEFSCIGIAHTRWATHGVPSETNAHPHASEDGRFWLVHNGIIENYKDLKLELEKEGYKFKTTTDTEIIAQLISKYYQDDLKKAVLKALTRLIGAFAISVISTEDPQRLIGAKKGSPLVLGVGKDEFILASDVSAIINHTRQVIYLEDQEIVDIKDGKYHISNLHNQQISKQIHIVDWSAESATKSGWDHFFIKEIMEQPETLKDSVRGRLVKSTGSIKLGGLIDVLDRIKEIQRIVLVGVGTAYYACKLGEIYFEDIARIPAKAEMSPEFRYKNPYLDSKTWVIAVSQSGETADTIGAIQEAQAKGALVTGVVNVVGSTISRMTKAGVYNHVGPEISVASSKAFTSQSLVLLTHAIMLGRMRNLSLTEGSSLIQDIQNLPKLAQQVLSKNQEIKALAQKYFEYQNLVYLGRKYNYPTAMEGALKIKELSYIHAEGLGGGELKHGFIALIDQNMPSITLATKDSVYEKQISNAEEVKARGGKILAVATEGDERVKQLADDVIFVPLVREELSPIVNTIVMQLLAYHVANLKGLDVDKPRNLAKSVTVE
jgi:glucosamine--fructose-6-phosphate aminotransferase (isomerizing)